MRNTLLPGILLAVAAGLLVIIGSALDLELDSAALFGVAVGAIVALVPDRTPLVRLGAFAVGYAVTWVGYAIRAALLPDTSSGRAVTAFIVLLLVAAIAFAVRDRLPMWGMLLGVAGLTGAYEYTYDAAPPEFLTTSVTISTTLLLALAVGFVVASFAAPDDAVEASPRRPRPERGPESESHDPDSRLGLGEIMENSK